MAFDGETHFCPQCGKAGFKSEMAVRGHLGACQGREGVVREIRELGAAPAAAAAAAAPAAAAAAVPAVPVAVADGAGGTAFQLLALQRRKEHLEQDNARLRRIVAFEQQRANTATRYATNHVPHLMTTQSSGPSFWSQFLTPHVKFTLIAIGVVLFLEFLRGDGSDLKKKIATKVGDRLITRVLG